MTAASRTQPDPVSPAQNGAAAPGVGHANTVAEFTASEFLEMRKRGEVSTVEYARACLDRIEQFNPALGAFECHDADRVMNTARECDEAIARGEWGGAVNGVPVGVKDIFNTYDFPTARGSVLWRGYTPGNDARVVSDVRGAGGIVVGKTVTSELAVHHPARTVNPHDTSRSPGTSSSGSATAVVARMAPVALASQTAGSLIRPSSYCGAHGFKPSFGLLPRTAMLKTTDTLDTVGLMARSVADLRLMFDVTRVAGHNYPVTERALHHAEHRHADGKAWKVGVVVGPKTGVHDPVVRERLAALADRLADAGAEVAEFRLPADFDEAHALHERIYRKALSYYFKDEYADRPTMFSDVMRHMIERGLSISTDQYIADTARQSELGGLLDASLSGRVDVTIDLSSASEAPPRGSTRDPDDHCLIWTMCGNPAVSLPLLSGPGGLPVGVQITARKYADYRLLAFADFVERVAAD